MENLRGEQSLPVLDEMPDTRMPLLRPAKKTAIALETSPLKQALHRLPPVLERMPGPHMLPLRQARNTAIALETSPLKQALYRLPPELKGMPGPRMLPLRQDLKGCPVLACSYCDRPERP